MNIKGKYREIYQEQKIISNNSNNVSKQFCSSDTYRKLPDTIEEAERKKKKEVSAEDPFEEDKKECEDAGATYETISYSFNHKGYQEATVEAFTGSNIFVANG